MQSMRIKIYTRTLPMESTIRFGRPVNLSLKNPLN